MRSDTGTVWECSKSARCEFHTGGGSTALPCSGVEETRSFTPDRTLLMPEAVRAFEATLIKSALQRASIDLAPGDSHTRTAAKLLGITRQGLELILNPEKGRHKELAPLLTKLSVGGLGGNRRKPK